MKDGPFDAPESPAAAHARSDSTHGRAPQAGTPLADAFADALQYWMPALAASAIAFGAAYASLDPAKGRRTATFLVCRPTEPVASLPAAGDLARLVDSVEAGLTAVSAKADRGSELATMTIELGSTGTPEDARQAADQAVLAANAAIEAELNTALLRLEELVEANRRSLEEAASLLAQSVGADPAAEPVAGLMQQMALLRETRADLLARRQGFGGIRTLGNMQFGNARSASSRWVASAAAAGAAAVCVPVLLRFRRQVSASRGALRHGEAR